MKIRSLLFIGCTFLSIGEVAVCNDAPDAAPVSNYNSDADEIVVVVNGYPVAGKRVLPANDKTFRLLLSDTAQTVELFWKDMEPMERRRVKQLYGLDEHDGRTVWGKKTMAVRLHLASGKDVIGLPVPNRNYGGRIALKTANAPLMLVPEDDIQSREPLEAFESEFYSPQEVYQRWMTEKPPGDQDAAAHNEMAHRCVVIGLYKEALDHLKCAEIIDPRTLEVNRDFRAMVVAEDARRATLEIYQKLLHAIMTEHFIDASDFLAKLDRNFPNSEFRSRWDGLRSKIEIGLKNELKASVIPLSYQVLLDLLQKEVCRTYKIDAKGNLVAAIPGKSITTNQGDVFTGTLAPSEYSNFIGLKVGDMLLSIARKDIKSMVDVQLDQGDTSDVRRPTFDQVFSYVIDTKKRTGLKQELIATLATKVNAPEDVVREVFDGRLTDGRARYEGGVLKKEKSYTIAQEIFYDKGSWLRQGVKTKPQILSGQAPEAEPGQKKDLDAEKEFSDDPNVWWEHQNSEMQIQILRALAAEFVFKATQVLEEKCYQCQGAGSAQGAEIVYRCPICRGTGMLFRIRYH